MGSLFGTLSGTIPNYKGDPKSTKGPLISLIAIHSSSYSSKEYSISKTGLALPSYKGLFQDPTRIYFAKMKTIEPQ